MNVYNWFCLLTAICTSRANGKAQSKAIVFPESHEDNSGELQEIPIDFARRLSQVNDVSELLHNFVDTGSMPIMGDVVSEAIRTAKMAACMPETQTVEIKPTKDPSIFYYPSCTRVQRCGGCCSHDLLQCQPVESEILQMSVVVTEYRGGRQLAYRGKDIVSIEQHTKCKCDCRIKEADCSPYQKYDKDSCRCVCNNHDKEAKCNEEINIKLWSPTECACICREPRDCSTGHYFDKFTCECVAERTRRVNSTLDSDFDRWSYNVH